MMCAAGLVDRHFRHEIVRLHDLVGQYPRLDLLAADVGEHLAVDLDARTEHLTALFSHFLALGQVVDDVAVFVGQVVFLEHGAHAVAPAAGWFQIGNDFRFFHSFAIIGFTMPIYCHILPQLQRVFIARFPFGVRTAPFVRRNWGAALRAAAG